MAIDRRGFVAGAALTGVGLGAIQVAAKEGQMPPTNEDGLHVQDWFVGTFLDLKEDFATALEARKSFAVLFEQRGCPYCRELHRVNFAKQQILSYIKANFDVLQINLWGAKEVTDFDGKALEERRLAQRWRVNFTPTMVFFPMDAGAVADRPGGEATIFRMPGYFKPFHFLAMLEYVHDGHWKKEGFQRFLQSRIEKIKERGEKPEVW